MKRSTLRISHEVRRLGLSESCRPQSAEALVAPAIGEERLNFGSRVQDFVRRIQYWMLLLFVAGVLFSAWWLQSVFSETSRGWWPALPYPVANASHAAEDAASMALNTRTAESSPLASPQCAPELAAMHARKRELP
jgi:hypothetical protein